LKKPALHVIITDNTTWSIWNFRLPLVERLLETGYQVTLLAPVGEHSEKLGSIGCRVVNLTLDRKGLSPTENFKLFFRMRRVFKQKRPDVVLGYTIKNNIFGALAARSLRIPFIPNITGLGTSFLSSGVLQIFVEVLYKVSFKRLQVIFFQNHDDRDHFVERKLVKPLQARVIPGSGIDVDRFEPHSYPKYDEKLVFLFIGRLLRDKGIYEFVGAAKEVKRKYPNTIFKILGSIDAANTSGVQREVLENWIDEGVIEYEGVTSDVRPFINAANCIVLPSYREGAPRTLIEAASMARPLISTDVPGCRSVVKNGENGILCEARSTISLVAAIEAFLDLSNDERCEMGKSGRAKIQREFDSSIISSSYFRAINEVVDRGNLT
jgi:glycosyltransferase involved in cell wall biosynthesis